MHIPTIPMQALEYDKEIIMCGIMGYVGEKEAIPIVLEGLKKLEYRGYDSAGIAINNLSSRAKKKSKPKISILKCQGRISNLESFFHKKHMCGHIGIGHTRWATHGEPSRKNAHPHQDCNGRIAVVHNGIIENYEALKKELEKDNCVFRSQTDSEVIPNLISKFYKGDLKKAVQKAVKKLKGSYALGIISIDEPEKILAIKNDSSLIIGISRNGNFIASDVPAILEYTKKIIYLQNKQIAVIKKDSVDISDLDNKQILPKIEAISYNIDTAKKGKFEDFMLKEICEQPSVLSKIISQWVDSDNRIKSKKLNLKVDFLRNVENLIIVACGTAFHAGLVGKYVLEYLTRIPVWVDLASEFRYRKPIINKNSLIVAISQSGETADTLAAVRKAKESKAHIISICNVYGSALTRESDSTFYTYAGPEISVASTKAYTAQLMTLYLFALYLAKLRGNLEKNFFKKAISSLKKVVAQQERIITTSKNIKRIAKRHLHFGAFLYLGRGINFPTALEGALKLKELSYIPAEGYAAGEMKHGPIALIDEYRAVVCIVDDLPIYYKMLSNIQEIIARKGKVIVIASEGNKQLENFTKELIFIPKIDSLFSPLLNVIPLQFLAYYIAKLKGYDVDRPRNLAKSVTVE